MVNYFRALKTIVQSPKARVHDVRWLETLPAGDYLAAQDIVCEKLAEFLAEDNPLDQGALDALMLIDGQRASTILTLTQQYVHATSLPREVDERMWQSVCRYYAGLIKAYQRFLDRYLEDASSLPHDLPQLLLNILDCHLALAKWRYFRFQQVGLGEWLQMHRIYLLVAASQRG
jgi:hypothetical protein